MSGFHPQFTSMRILSFVSSLTRKDFPAAFQSAFLTDTVPIPVHNAIAPEWEEFKMTELLIYFVGSLNCDISPRGTITHPIAHIDQSCEERRQ